MGWAWKQLTGHPSTKVVLMALADQAGWDTWQCWPSQALLAERCELGVRSVRRHLETLEAAGYIRRAPRRRANGSRSSDLVTLMGSQAANLAGGPRSPVSGQ